MEIAIACFARGATGAHQVPDSGKLDNVSAKGERILLTRHAEPAKYWEGKS